MLHDWKGQLLICAIFTLCFLPAIFAVFISTNLETINTKVQTTSLKDNILLLSEFTPNSKTAIEKKLANNQTEIDESLQKDGVKSQIKGLELNVSWLWFESKTPVTRNEDTGRNQEISKITLLPADVYSQNSRLEQNPNISTKDKVIVPMLYNSYLSKIRTNSKDWLTIQRDMRNSLHKLFPVYSAPLVASNKAKQLDPNFEIQFVGYGGSSSANLGVLTSKVQEKLQAVNTDNITVNSISVLEFADKASKENFIKQNNLEYDKFENKITRLLSIVTFTSAAIFALSLIILILISARDLLGSKVDLAMFCAMGINRASLILIYIVNYAVLSFISLLVSVILTVLVMVYLSNFTNLYFDLLSNLITSPDSINHISIFTTDYGKLVSSLLVAFIVTLLPFSLIIPFIQKLNIISTLK